jgi:hypothetical protein
VDYHHQHRVTYDDERAAKDPEDNGTSSVLISPLERRGWRAGSSLSHPHYSGPRIDLPKPSFIKNS